MPSYGGDAESEPYQSAGCRCAGPGGGGLLKEFVRYAEQGAQALNADAAPTGFEADSQFEEEVGREVERLGYAVHKQVGCSGYRIDLAVVDPARPGRYMLGIVATARYTAPRRLRASGTASVNRCWKATAGASTGSGPRNG